MPRLTVPSSHHSNFFLPTSHLPLTLMSLSSYCKDLCVYIALTQIIEDNLPDSKPLTYLHLKVPLTIRYRISGSGGDLMDVTLPNTIMRKRWVEFLDFRSQRTVSNTVKIWEFEPILCCVLSWHCSSFGIQEGKRFLPLCVGEC